MSKRKRRLRHLEATVKEHRKHTLARLLDVERERGILAHRVWELEGKYERQTDRWWATKFDEKDKRIASLEAENSRLMAEIREQYDVRDKAIKGLDEALKR